MGTITSFTGLHAWQEGHKLAIDIYAKTKRFPKEELFGLTNQLRRAGVSVTSNIAEGFSRNSYPDKLQFYCVGLGSLTEIQSQVLIARDIGYLGPKEFEDIAQQTILVSKLLNGLIKSTRIIIRTS